MAGLLLLLAVPLARSGAQVSAAAQGPPSSVHTAALNRDPEVVRAYQRFYNLEYDDALAAFQKIAAEHPQDPVAVDYVLNATVFRNLYALDLLDTTLYAHDGFLSNKRPITENKAVTEQVETLTAHAIELSDTRLKTNAKDEDALFARAWARSLRAVYVGLVQHSYITALRQALAAREDDDAVLKLDPEYVDAELVVGVHQYVLGVLPRGFRILAGMAGMHGDRQRGLALLRDDGQRGVITSVEARTALMLFLRREGKYPEATDIARSLKEQYPRDFLFTLEQANLLKDEGNSKGASNAYQALLTAAEQPGYFPNAHLELAWFGYGETLRGQKDHTAAAHAFKEALAQPEISAELKRRAQLELAEEYDALGKRDEAVQAYEHLRRESPESPQADEAGRYLRTPFQG